MCVSRLYAESAEYADGACCGRQPSPIARSGGGLITASYYFSVSDGGRRV